MVAKFKQGDRVKVVKILDDFTNKGLIGFVGTVQDVDPLPNGEFNYTVNDHYMHEVELEYAGCKICGVEPKGVWINIMESGEMVVVVRDTQQPFVLNKKDKLCDNCHKVTDFYRRIR